ncbi:MAG: hypothetical protein ACYCXA_09385 [Actinomycetes bacterium]
MQLLTRTITNYISSWNQDSASFRWVATAAEILERVALVERDYKKLLACNFE